MEISEYKDRQSKLTLKTIIFYLIGILIGGIDYLTFYQNFPEWRYLIFCLWMSLIMVAIYSSIRKFILFYHQPYEKEDNLKECEHGYFPGDCPYCPEKLINKKIKINGTVGRNAESAMLVFYSVGIAFALILVSWGMVNYF